MKICFIGPANSAHVLKWCSWFSKQGHEVFVVSFTNGSIPGVKVHLIDLGVKAEGGDISKLKYLTAGRSIRKNVESINPDVISVHYATSYGIAVALSGIKHYSLSVWGSDIYEFPRKSFFHKTMLKISLNKAKLLMSTSKAMAKEAEQYTSKSFEITPFGVDTELFSPRKRTRKDGESFIVGTVKGLSDVYGIRNIIEAVAMVKEKTNIPIRLRIAGKGPKEEEYRRLAKDLEIGEITTWLGFISQEEAALEWANMDLAIIPSISESFGVAALEAQSSSTPVIISSIPGLMETTIPGVTSMAVQPDNSEELYSAIVALFYDEKKRKNMGERGRSFVVNEYSIKPCFEHIEKLLLEFSSYR